VILFLRDEGVVSVEVDIVGSGFILSILTISLKIKINHANSTKASIKSNSLKFVVIQVSTSLL
jgi:hypothetical protein